MNLLEKVGWTAGIVALVSSQIPSIFGDYPIVKAATFFGSLAVLGITAILHLKKSTKFQSKTKGEESSFDMQSYSNHIRDLFGFAESVRSSSYPQYMETIYDLENSGQKKMILQHFFTHYRNSDTRQRLYDLYQKAITMHNKLESNRDELLNNFFKYPGFQKFGISEYPSDDWIKVDDFKRAVGIEASDLYQNHFRFSYSGFYNIFDDFSIEWDGGKKEWVLGYSTYKLVGSKSKEKLEKFLDYIKKYNVELRNKAEKLNDTLYPLYVEVRPIFDSQFTEIYEPSRNGNPMLGVCDGCIEYFVGTEKNKYEKILANFNSKTENWDVSLWR